MTFRKGSYIRLITLGMCLLASHAQAFMVTDVNIQNATGDFESSSAAQQGKGTTKQADINENFAGDPWTLLDETKKTSTPFHDVSFTFSADVKKTSGAWELSWDASDAPLSMDFVVVIKGEGQWGAYLFEAVSVSSDIGRAGGNFQMPWINKHGKVAKLDHASIYGRLADIPVGPNANAIPIPGSLALMAMGLVLLFHFRLPI